MAAPAVFLASVVHEYVRLGSNPGGQQPGAPPRREALPAQQPGGGQPEPKAGQQQRRPHQAGAQRQPGLAAGGRLPGAPAPGGDAEEDSSSVSSSSDTPPRRVRRRVDLRPKAPPAMPPPPPAAQLYPGGYQGGWGHVAYHPPQAVHAGAWGFPHPPPWAPVQMAYYQPHRGHPGHGRGNPGNAKGHRGKGDKGAGRGDPNRGRRAGRARVWVPGHGWRAEPGGREAPKGGAAGKPAGKRQKGDRKGDHIVVDPDRRVRDHEVVSDSS
jgi:hypothetical protein